MYMHVSCITYLLLIGSPGQRRALVQGQAELVLKHVVDHHKRELKLDWDCTEGVLMRRILDLIEILLFALI